MQTKLYEELRDLAMEEATVYAYLKTQPTTPVWIAGPQGNWMLKSDDESFYISVQRDPHNPFGNADDMQAETAICVDGKYYILNGDWGSDYEKLVPLGLDACLDFYKAHPESVSSWSNEL